MSSSIEPPDVDVRHALEPQCRQRPLDGDALRIEDARLRAHEHARAHGYEEEPSARATQAENGWPVIVS